MLRVQAGCSDRFHSVWQASKKVIQRNSTSPPIFCGLWALIDVGVVTNQTIHFIRLKNTVVILLAQYFVAAANALALRIIWQLYLMPAIGF